MIKHWTFINWMKNHRETTKSLGYQNLGCLLTKEVLGVINLSFYDSGTNWTSFYYIGQLWLLAGNRKLFVFFAISGYYWLQGCLFWSCKTSPKSKLVICRKNEKSRPTFFSELKRDNISLHNSNFFNFFFSKILFQEKCLYIMRESYWVG